MGAVRTFSNLSNLSDFPSLSKFLSAWAQDVTQQVNGNLELVKNMKAAGPYSINVVIGSSTAHKLDHSLGRVPAGYLLVYQDAATTIYAVNSGTSSWTNKAIYLKASGGSGTVNATLYLI